MKHLPFVQNLIDQCVLLGGTVILPEAHDPRTLEAAEFLLNAKACSRIILLGLPRTIESLASPTLRHSLGSISEIFDISDTLLQNNVMEHVAKAHQLKGRSASAEQLSKIANDPLYHAGLLLSQDPTACVVAGAVATTADVIRAAIGTVGLAKGVKTVSGGFFMDRSQNNTRESFYFADAGVVVEPTVEQLVDIAIASSDTWGKIMSTKPVIAFLSFSTKGSAQHPAAEKMAAATKLFQERFPNIEADGELQFDAAFVKSVGERKAPSSKIPGRANIFIFPDLSSGNIAYKVTQRLGGFDAYGPILQGLYRPYSDLSRGASAADIAVSAMINLMRR